MKRVKEPARVKLFWVAVYLVLFGICRDIIVDLWKSCVDFVSDRHKVLWILAVPFLIFAYSLLIVTFLLILICSFIIAFFNYIVGAMAFIIDSIYLGLKKMARCPACKRRYSIPTYICPVCGAEHKALRPGRYGIFYRTCSCGTKIPSISLLGRNKLDYKCPHCGKKHSRGSQGASQY